MTAADLTIGATFRVPGTETVWTVEAVRETPEARRIFTVRSPGGFRQVLPLHDAERVLEREVCPVCTGAGVVRASNYAPCLPCDGVGEVFL